jgi:hypothetical protein
MTAQIEPSPLRKAKEYARKAEDLMTEAVPTDRKVATAQVYATLALSYATLAHTLDARRG